MGILEREFEKYKALHKYAILKVKLVQYFRDLEEDLPQIPDFMRKGETPEDKADIALRHLVMDFEKFNRLYETAYNDLAEVLP